jgi:hypothetical protein
MTSRKGIGGRPPGIIDYRDVRLNDKEYTVGTLSFNNSDIHFVIDKEDFPLIRNRPWHFASGNYISTAVIDEGRRKDLYIHNVVMNRLGHPGKGATETVDHINRIGLDNRKENLRIVTQSEQNLYQGRKKRSVVLPEGFPIKLDDIPRHIWYVRANGLHGDRFAIEFRTENIVWKTTSSKAVSIQQKLTQAKEKLEELYLKYPHLNQDRPERLIEIENLTRSFNEIIAASLTPS